MRRCSHLFSTYPFWLLLFWVSYEFFIVWGVRFAAGWRDGPEFVDTSWVLGIAHPAGYPLYQSLVWMWEQFPLGDVVLRNHAFSAGCTVLAGVFLYHAGLSFMRVLGHLAVEGDRGRLLAGFVSVSWLVMAPQLEDAIQSEAYALHAVLTFVVCRLLFDFMRTREVRRYVLAVFVAAVGAGNHITMGVFVFAFIMVLGVLPDVRQAFRAAGAGMAAGVWGLLVYMYLPVRSRRDPSFDWGNPEGWDRFWRHVLDRKDASGWFQDDHGVSVFGGAAWDYGQMFYHWLGVVGVVALLSGWLWLLWRHFRLGMVSLFWVVFLFVFFPGWTSGTIFSGALGILLLGLIPVLGALLWRWDEASDAVGLASLGGAVLVLGAVFLHLYGSGISFLAKRSDYLPTEAVERELLSVPYRASVLNSTHLFHLRALADIGGMRPDVTLIGLGDIISPQYFQPLKPSQIPMLIYPRVRLPDTTPPDPGLVKTFLSRLIDANAARSRFYLEMSADYIKAFDARIDASNSLWARLLQPGEERASGFCGRLGGAFVHRLGPLLQEARAGYDVENARFLEVQYFAWLYAALKVQPACTHLAERMIFWWMRWMDTSNLSMGEAYNKLGIIYMLRGYDRGARIMFQLAHAAGSVPGGVNLGRWFEAHGRKRNAGAVFKDIFLRTGYEVAFREYRRLLRGL